MAALTSFGDDAFTFDFIGLGDINPPMADNGQLAAAGGAGGAGGASAATDGSADAFSMDFLPMMDLGGVGADGGALGDGGGVGGDGGVGAGGFFDASAWGDDGQGATGAANDFLFHTTGADAGGEMADGLDPHAGAAAGWPPAPASAGATLPPPPASPHHEASSSSSSLHFGGFSAPASHPPGGMLPPSPIRPSSMAAVHSDAAPAVVPTPTQSNAVAAAATSHGLAIGTAQPQLQQQRKRGRDFGPDDASQGSSSAGASSAAKSPAGRAACSGGVPSSSPPGRHSNETSIEGVRLSFNTSASGCSPLSSASTTSAVATEHQHRCQALLHDVDTLLAELDATEQQEKAAAKAATATDTEGLDAAVFEARVQQLLRSGKAVSESAAQAAADLVVLSTSVLKMFGPNPILGRLLGEEFVDAPSLFVLPMLLAQTC